MAESKGWSKPDPAEGVVGAGEMMHHWGALMAKWSLAEASRAAKAEGKEEPRH